MKKFPGDPAESNQRVIMRVNMETLGRAMFDHTSGSASMLFAIIRAIITVPHLDDMSGSKDIVRDPNMYSE